MPLPLPDAPLRLAAALIAVLLGGAMRGFTGFGSAIVMAPILSPLLGPAVAVPAILGLDLLLNIRLVPEAARRARWRELVRIAIGAGLLLPAGAWLIVYLPEKPLVVAVGVIVIVAALVLFTGWQYRGPVNAATDGLVGALAGFLGGATSIGGPPVVIYFMARPGTAVQNRADLIGVLALINVLGLVTFAAYGTVTWTVALLVVAGLPVYIAGSELGRLGFWRVRERGAKRVILALLLLNGLLAIATALLRG